MDGKVNQIRQYLRDNRYTIVGEDLNRPWGAFFRLADSDSEQFIKMFFAGLSDCNIWSDKAEERLSPKILLVKPGQRLSWQYHDRRAEYWSFLTNGSYISSRDNSQSPLVKTSKGDVIKLDRGERHRLIGLPNDYVIVAEIWQHTDPRFPSDEADIVRLADDYDRS